MSKVFVDRLASDMDKLIICDQFFFLKGSLLVDGGGDGYQYDGNDKETQESVPYFQDQFKKKSV